MTKFNSNSVTQTLEIGNLIGKSLSKGDILLLSGEMGAGKTHLTKGIAAGLGVEKTVLSPTFAIHKSYSGKNITLNHFDFFRICDSSEIENLGLDEVLFSKDGIAVVEWWQNVSQLFSQKKYKHVKISKTGKNTRTIEVTF